jgi:hypothetical protein
MTHEETLILNFMKERPDTAFARKEIARKAVKRSEYDQNQHWLDQPLAALVASGTVEIDDSGHYILSKDHRG